MRWVLVVLILGVWPVTAAIRGAAMWGEGAVISWGDRVEIHSLLKGRSKVVARGDFGEGGCVATLGGEKGVVLQSGHGLGKLVWMTASSWKPEVIDTEMDTHDCLGATLHGREGILAVHRYGQVRFHERPAKAAARWPYTEIYSFYTASRQAGLLLKDVDGDGRQDIVCGDYWIWNPASFELGWRLFAIHLWFETPDSATVRIAPGVAGVVEAQGHMDEARLAWLEPKGDVRQQWTQRRLGEELGLKRVHGLDTVDADGDGRLDVLAGEDSGAGSRLLLFLNRGDRFEHRVLGTTGGVVFLKAADVDGDGRPDVVLAGTEGVRWRKIENR